MIMLQRHHGLWLLRIHGWIGHAKSAVYAGAEYMLIGRPITIPYFLARKITAEGAEERYKRLAVYFLSVSLCALGGKIPGLVAVPLMSRPTQVL
ncbi:MAG: hypothetical protein C5S47_04575 [Candidatus Methanogasteraceae archaeon]|nr:MAG: hypothetical protein C5S47_04575 [ANME-2 cluster archaeon]